MQLNPRTWRLWSLLLLAAAALCWWLADLRHPVSQSRSVPAPTPVSNVAVPAASPAAPYLTLLSQARPPLADPEDERAKANPDPAILHPHRLTNTRIPYEHLMRRDTAILLHNALIDTRTRQPLPIPEHLRAGVHPGGYLVHSRLAGDAEFQQRLRRLGAELVSYIPHNTWLVRADPGTASRIETVAAVESILPWEPYYKLDPSLLDVAVHQDRLPMVALLRLTLFPGTEVSAAQRMEALGAPILGTDRNPFGAQLIVRPPPDALAAIARLPEVQLVEPFKQRVLLNDKTRPRIGLATNGVVGTNYLGLTGTNVVVTVIDLCVDTNHPDLTPRALAQITINTLSNRFIAAAGSPTGPFVTQQFAIFIPRCAAEFHVELMTNQFSVPVLPGIEIYASTNPNPSTNIANLVNTNFAIINASNPQWSTNRTWFYDLVNTNAAGVNFDLQTRIYDGLDPAGHGTFVAGIIAGGGVTSPTSSPIDSAPGANFRGIAPESQIMSIRLDSVPGGYSPGNQPAFERSFDGVPFGGVGTISDAALQEAVIRTNRSIYNRTNGPHIVNNSWGYDPGFRFTSRSGRDRFDYDSHAASWDMAVRDGLPGLPGEQSLIPVFAAGNRGGGANSGGGGIADTIVSPATAKNVITIGAIESRRDSTTSGGLAGITNLIIRPNGLGGFTTNAEWQGFTDSSNQVWAGSSRGNVGIFQEGRFGRFKPDLVAPGTATVSLRSPSWDENSYYNPLDVDVFVITNLTLASGRTNVDQVFVTLNTTNFSIALINRSGNADLLIYTNRTQNPSQNGAADLAGTNAFSTPMTPADSGLWYYDVVNTNLIPVTYDVVITLIQTNNFGNYFLVLSNLNEALKPTYRYELTGTSQSAPVVSGLLALMQQFFEQGLTADGLGRTNSPALMKALLINGARAVSANYGLQVTNFLNLQGWGIPQIPNVIPPVLAADPDPTRWPLQFFDQHPTNAIGTGESHVRNLQFTPAATNTFMRVTLVWTDPPGNPAAGIKLVNDLDLVVSNRVTGVLYHGNNFPGGGDFTAGNVGGTNGTNIVAVDTDVVNNVENVYLNGLDLDYDIYVTGKRVNVNAASGQTNGIGQDYALVVSIGQPTLAGGFTLDQVPTKSTNTLPQVQFVGGTNAIFLRDLRVGANDPFLTSTNGTTNQWVFLVITNVPSGTNAAFAIFRPPNLARPRRDTADLDLFVSLNSDLTNLFPAVVDTALKSTNRGGTEIIALSNNVAGTTYYVGIKSEDQQSGDFDFFAAFTDQPFARQNEDGSVDIFPLNIPAGGLPIPDGSPESPGVTNIIAINPTVPITIRRVVVSNYLAFHELWGDWTATITHENREVVLNSHDYFPTLNPGPNGGTNNGGIPPFTIFDDSGQGDIFGAIRTAGPTSLQEFIGQDGIGLWQITLQDNQPAHTGRFDNVTIHIDPANTNNIAGGGGGGGGTTNRVTLGAGGTYYDVVRVPPGAVSLTIDLRFVSTNAGPVEIYVRYGDFPDLTPPPLFDHFAVIQSPGGSLTITRSDVPPLRPGRYFILIRNISGATTTFDLSYRTVLDLNLDLPATFASTNLVILPDDAMTNAWVARINVNLPGNPTVATIRPAVRIDHERASDLALHVVGPNGRRVLLGENRGSSNTLGYGMGTNVNPFELAFTAFSDDTNQAQRYIKYATNRALLDFRVPRLVNTNYMEDTAFVIPGGSSTGSGTQSTESFSVPTAGTMTLDWMFYMAPDRIQVFNNGLLIHDTQCTNNFTAPLLFYDFPGNAINGAQDIINISTHGYTNGQQVSFTSTNFPLYWGVSPGTRYFVERVNANQFAVHTSAALSGRVNLSNATPQGGPPPTPSANQFFRILPWVTDVIPFSAGTIDIVVNPAALPACSGAGTVWNYFYTLSIAGSTAFFDQRANGAVVQDGSLYLSGTTEGRNRNGLIARLGLPIHTNASNNIIPLYSFNWPDSQGGTRFAGAVSAGGPASGLYAVGSSTSRTTDADGVPGEPKGIAVKIPLDTPQINPVGQPHGSVWYSQVPPANTFPGAFPDADLEELLATAIGEEFGTNYLYVTGYGQTNTAGGNPGRLMLAKLDTNGVVLWATNDAVTGVTNYSAGTALKVLGTNIYVAGVSNDSVNLRTYLTAFDTNGVALWSTNHDAGQYHALATYNGDLFAVGEFHNAGTTNFLIHRLGATNGALIWSQQALSVDAVSVLRGLLPFGDRLYAVGYTDDGVVRRGVLLELDQATGNLITDPATGYTGVTLFNGGRNWDAFHGVASDGFDLYVVGEGRRFDPAVRTDTDVLILRFQIKHDYFPEEPMDPLIGISANGDWLLEIWDTRAGGTNNPPRLLGWQIQFQFAFNNQSGVPLEHMVGQTNTMAATNAATGIAPPRYFIVQVPFTATYATNTLNLISSVPPGTGQLELWFNQNGLPSFGGPGDVLLLNGVTTGTSILNSGGGFPVLVPGQRYYLAVRNQNNFETNTFSLRVDFDQTATTFSTVNSFTSGSLGGTGGGGGGGGGGAAPANSALYQFVLPTGSAYGSFSLHNLVGDVRVRLRRGAVPSATAFHFEESFAGTNFGRIWVDPSETLPAIDGTWYAQVERLGDAATFAVRARAENEAPVLPDFANVVINEGVVHAFSAAAADPEEDGVTYTLEQGPAGASFDPGTGAFSWTVTEADGPGIYPVSIRATDDFERSKSSTVSFSITVNELNSPPQLALPGNQIIDELTPLNVSASATDPDLPANTLTFTLVSGPPGLTLDSTSGAISWTPTEAQGPGNYRVTIQVTDNGTPPASDTRDFFITVNEANSAPSLVNPGTRTVDEHVTFSLTLQGSDSDVPVQSLTYSLLSGPPGMTLTGNQLAWTPDESFGGTTQTIQVRVTDNGSPNLSAIQTFDLVVNEVNNAPLILSPGNKTVDELVTLIVAAQAVDSDTPAQTLTFALASGPAGAVVDAATGQFSWTPAEADGPGTYTVRVKVTDNGSPARSATNTFTVTVNEVNIAPVLAQPAAQTVDEHQLLSLNLSATDSDLPANTLTYLLVSGPSGLTVNAAGLLRWTPGEAHGGGSFSVTVRVRDNGTPQLSDTQTFTVAVNEVNAAPALTRPADQTVNERESLSLQLAATDSDDPPQTLTYDLVSGPSGVSVSASGLLTWTPSESEGGSAYSIVVRVTDNGSPARSDSKLFLITVNDVNTAPTLTRPADQTVDEHVLLSLQLVGADDDLPAQALTYELVSGPAGMSVSSGGLLTWTPGEAEGGNSHTVTVRVRDDGSPALSATQSFSVTVSEVNAAPVLATIASQTMDECANLGLLMVATDADLPVQTLAFSLGEGAPAGATIDGSSGLFTFDQPSGAGVHTVSVIVTDNGTPSLSATQTFTITVNSRPTNVVDLAVGTALSATNTPCTQWKTYYRLTVPSGATRALFELTGLSGDVDLLLRRGAFPTDATFDYASATAGTASEQVVVVTNATLTDLGGEWFVAARNNSGGEAGFRVGTGLPTVVEGGTILLSPEAITLAATPVVFSGDSPQIQWTTVAGEKYQVEVSTDLSAWTVLSNVIVSGPNSTFTDPTPYADNQQRFYRIRQVPQ